MKLIDNESIDLVVTDPPYKVTSGGCKDTVLGGSISRKNNNYTANGKIFKENKIKFKDWFPDIFKILKEGTHFYVMCNDKNLKEVLIEGEKAGFKEVNILVWEKGTHIPTQYYMKNIEFIVMFRKGRAKYINNMGTFSLLKYKAKVGNRFHPTEKPIELMVCLIENSSNKKDLILDPFIGSGTTALACLKSNRNYIGFELDKEYSDIANKRIEEYVNTTK